MSTEKKVVTKTKKGNNLPKEKQNKIKILSKIIYIVARIFKVLTVIGASCLLLAIVLTPVIIKNIKIENDTVSIFDMELNYKYNANQVDLLVGDIPIGKLEKNEKINFDIMINELAKTDMTKSFAFFELGLIASVAVMFIMHFIFRYVDELFVNIYNNDTPFTNENTDYLSKISYLTLTVVIISFVSDLISSLFFGNSIVHISLSDVLIVLVLYTVTYIFEYACILQKDSKHKIYE